LAVLDMLNAVALGQAKRNALLVPFELIASARSKTIWAYA